MAASPLGPHGGDGASPPSVPQSESLLVRSGGPRLAPDVEALGEYQGSGLVESVYLLRHAGRTLAVSSLLYQLVGSMDGSTTLEETASRVSAATGRDVSREDVTFLIEHKLRPLGLLADGTSSARKVPHAVTALATRRAVVPERLTCELSRVLACLFQPAIVVGTFMAFVAMDIWLLRGRSLTLAVPGLANDPVGLVLLCVLTVAAGGFHEFGHAAATYYGGARPGVIGVGIYLIWPAFFSDLTDSYRLSRTARLRTDLGGVYFNMVFMLVLGILYAVTGVKALPVAIGIQHAMVLQQFLPFVRLDGYYVVSDLAGVPDLIGRIRPVLRGLVSGRARDVSSELTAQARVLVTGWVVATVLATIAGMVWFGLRLPGLLVTAAAFVDTQAALVAGLMRRGEVAGLLGALRLAALAVPVVGLAVPLRRAIRAHAERRSTQSSGARREQDLSAPPLNRPFAALQWPPESSGNLAMRPPLTTP